MSNTPTMEKTFNALVVSLALTLATSSAASAQVPGLPPPAQQEPAPATPPDTVAPDSPRAAFLGFSKAASSERWDDAARFLALSRRDRGRGPELARQLNAVLETLYLLHPDSISGMSEGDVDDDLPDGVEEIGQVTFTDTSEPVRMVRTSGVEGVSWMFAPATVARISAWYEDLPATWVQDRLLAAGLPFLLRSGPFDILLWQWIALPFVALAAWGVGFLLHTLGRPLVERLSARTQILWDNRVVSSIGPPFALAMALVSFVLGCVLIELPRPVVQFIAAVMRAGIAFAVFWGLWRFSAVLAAWTLTRPWASSSASVRNLLTIGSNLSRGVIVALGVLAMVASLGYPVSTVLAGLGIGGLALAFGAQKTVENVFGSVSLAVDQPFRVGDFVKVEDFVGTIEDIGLRSTRFRTLDRTMISIPNGKLADQRLESFEARDRMRLATIVSLTYGTTRDQMQAVLAGIERVLRSHPRIWPDAVVVKFKEFGQSSLDIEIMAWFQVPTWSDFQRCREDVLLGFMEVVESAGTSFAFPTRTVHLVQQNEPGFTGQLASSETTHVATSVKRGCHARLMTHRSMSWFRASFSCPEKEVG